MWGLKGSIHFMTMFFLMFQGELHRDNLYKDAKDKFDQLKLDLANRKTRLSENVNFQFMVNWIMHVRGLSEENFSEDQIKR